MSIQNFSEEYWLKLIFSFYRNIFFKEWLPSLKYQDNPSLKYQDKRNENLPQKDMNTA